MVVDCGERTKLSTATSHLLHELSPKIGEKKAKFETHFFFFFGFWQTDSNARSGAWEPINDRSSMRAPWIMDVRDDDTSERTIV
jgi:hypothetical protein